MPQRQSEYTGMRFIIVDTDGDIKRIGAAYRAIHGEYPMVSVHSTSPRMTLNVAGSAWPRFQAALLSLNPTYPVVTSYAAESAWREGATLQKVLEIEAVSTDAR